VARASCLLIVGFRARLFRKGCPAHDRAFDALELLHERFARRNDGGLLRQPAHHFGRVGLVAKITHGSLSCAGHPFVDGVGGCDAGHYACGFEAELMALDGLRKPGQLLESSSKVSFRFYRRYARSEPLASVLGLGRVSEPAPAVRSPEAFREPPDDDGEGRELVGGPAELRVDLFRTSLESPLAGVRCLGVATDVRRAAANADFADLFGFFTPLGELRFPFSLCPADLVFSGFGDGVTREPPAEG
jgi:hypothetical protein